MRLEKKKDKPAATSTGEYLENDRSLLPQMYLFDRNGRPQMNVPKETPLPIATLQLTQVSMDRRPTQSDVAKAAGVHRAPMMTLAVMRAIGWKLHEAQKHIFTNRPVVDFADVYVQSVEDFVRVYNPKEK